MKKMVLMAVVAMAVTISVSGRIVAAPGFQVNGVSGNAFQSVTSVNEGGGSYWTGNSTDSTSSATIGNYLTKTGHFSSTGSSPNINPTNLRAFQNADGTAPSQMTYGVNASTNTFTLLIEVAGLGKENELWYMQPVGGGAEVLKRLFAGNASGGTQNLTLTITGEFALVLVRTENASDQSFLDAHANSGMSLGQLTGLGNTQYAKSTGGSSNNGTDQHFASFIDINNPNKVYTGIEDIVPLNGSDNDYNDMVISMLVEVPAPPALLLAALGIPALGLVRRWTRKTPADAVVA